MNPQRGSILAGVVGLTAGLSAVVAGFLAIATTTNRVETDSEADMKTHYAAEAGMHMGIRWLRTYPKDKTSLPDWPASPIAINNAFGTYSDFEGVQVKVIFQSSAGEYQNHKLRSLATLGPGRDTVEISMYLALTNDASTENYNGSNIFGVDLGVWSETIHPGK